MNKHLLVTYTLFLLSTKNLRKISFNVSFVNDASKNRRSGIEDRQELELRYLKFSPEAESIQARASTHTRATDDSSSSLKPSSEAAINRAATQIGWRNETHGAQCGGWLARKSWSARAPARANARTGTERTHREQQSHESWLVGGIGPFPRVCAMRMQSRKTFPRRRSRTHTRVNVHEETGWRDARLHSVGRYTFSRRFHAATVVDGGKVIRSGLADRLPAPSPCCVIEASFPNPTRLPSILSFLNRGHDPSSPPFSCRSSSTKSLCHFVSNDNPFSLCLFFLSIFFQRIAIPRIF